jgi:hypothetical protein
MIQKDILRRLLAGFYVLQFSTFLLCLTCYSYRARELLVCWLFFCLLFGILSLICLGAVLTFYAGQYLVKWVNVANTVIPELVVCLAELPQETASGPRILVAGTLEAAAGPYASVNALGARSRLLIEVTPSADKGVRNGTDTVLRAP